MSKLHKKAAAHHITPATRVQAVAPTIRSISQAPGRRAAAKMNANARATAVQSPNQKSGLKVKKGANKKQRRKAKPIKQPRMRLHPVLEALMRSRANPFSVRGAQIPHTNNEAQSLTCFTTATTAQLPIIVPIGHCVQINFFSMGLRGTAEGQGDNINSGPGAIAVKPCCSPGDAQAFHCRPVTFRDLVGTYNYGIISPSDMSVTLNVAGAPFYLPLDGFAALRSSEDAAYALPVGLADAQWGSVLSVSATRWNPVWYARELPIMGKAEGHYRYVLVSCGVKWSRTTPGGSSGGYVTSVSVSQPLKDRFGYGTFGQEYFSAYPSYHVSAEDEGIFLPAPRPIDNAFSHPAMTDTAYPDSPTAIKAEGCNTIEPVNGLLFLNNDTATQQHYQLEFVWNWQIAGDQVQPFTKPASLAPQLAPAVTQAANKLATVANVTADHVVQAYHAAAKETSIGAVMNQVQGAILDTASGFLMH